MPYKFRPGWVYMMPTHFGPCLNPRQGVEGRKYRNLNSPKWTVMSVSFLTNREQLEELLPEGFEVEAKPIVTVRAEYITEIEWLAGRGYNTLGVRFPAVFNGKEDHAEGNFLSVLWENLADPIVSGRESLGYSKIYCELPEPRVYEEQIHCVASWMDFKFMDMKIWNMTKLSREEIVESMKLLSKQSGDGVLHYKYIPRTEEWGKPDVCYATLTPSGNSNEVIKEAWRGEGTVKFHEATWEDLPTMVNIVNAFHNLEIKGRLEATVIKSVGGKDLGDQRILR